jgi:ABC-type dipeptide/oligopeptide/nickel transport system permease component
MLQYSVRRIGAAIPALLAVVIVAFAILRLIPGDPARFIGGENMGAEQIAVLRHTLGLDQPLTTQFWHYIDGLAHLDLGRSLTTQLQISSLIGHAMAYTVVIAISAVLIGIVIALPLGVLAAFARHRGKEKVDGVIMSIVMVMDNIPGFYLAILLIMLFTSNLGWLPLSGDVSWSHPGALAQRLVMPIMALALGTIGNLTRVTRASVVETLHRDYIRTARSLGASERTILFRHALPNAGLPIVTMVGLAVGRLVAGTIIVEAIFSIPGIGTQLIQAITSRDYPVIQGLILIYALIFVLINLATDIIYTVVDPRVRLS